ncbi:penicillin acylase family protein [Actinoplanes sp. Pm04-4]|uniref:Penicillin acylase family protein n=1 Tax=Paractinoplanes pyxinae TaxID=2997416 RepID=A0ABT4ASI6_9ACTN|nr:penicillin acylase family protein [Actinoplanes pyxinae]MCY1136782.1 penicillin acylase family protein [Actinoplanes pyxinae]
MGSFAGARRRPWFRPGSTRRPRRGRPGLRRVRSRSFCLRSGDSAQSCTADAHFVSATRNCREGDMSENRPNVRARRTKVVHSLLEGSRSMFGSLIPMLAVGTLAAGLFGGVPPAAGAGLDGGDCCVRSLRAGVDVVGGATGMRDVRAGAGVAGDASGMRDVRAGAGVAGDASGVRDVRVEAGFAKGAYRARNGQAGAGIAGDAHRVRSGLAAVGATGDAYGVRRLRAGGEVVRDGYGVPHLRAGDQYGLFRLQGWVHAEDRLFQMDVSRRRGAGTLAELIGGGALASDVQMRTLGLRRAAEKGLAVLSGETRAALKAYTEGVNDRIASGDLPEQYKTVRITKVAPWTEVDSLVVIKTLAFSLSFDLDIDRNTAVRGYQAAGFDGQKAVFGDLMPFAPFSTASPVSDSAAKPSAAPAGAASAAELGVAPSVAGLSAKKAAVPSAADAVAKPAAVPSAVDVVAKNAAVPSAADAVAKPAGVSSLPDAVANSGTKKSAADAVARRHAVSSAAGSAASANAKKSERVGELPLAVVRMAGEYLARAKRAPLIEAALNRSGDRGSNSWVIGGRHTANGRPILASDPHLSLETPSTFYPIDLRGGGFDVQGDSLPGTPFVILGQNRDIAYGATQHFMDVSDTYAEKVETDAGSPSGLATVYQGRREAVVAIPETFRVNPRTTPDTLETAPPSATVPERTLIVPRRNNGPLLTYDQKGGTGISVQYTGFSPTAELEAFRQFNLARDVGDFRRALQHFDVGGQHFVYADRRGTIAYFTNAEVPIREDLQAGKVRGNPPYLLRDGTGGNEWLPVRHRQPNQTLPYEIVPFAEMPQVVNPPAGFVVSANNDPTRNSFDNDMLNQRRPGGGISYLSFFHNGFRGGRITDMVRAAVRKGSVTAADVVRMQADTTALDAQYFVPMIPAALSRARGSSVPALAKLAQDERIVEAAGRLNRWDHTYPTDSAAASIYVLWRGRFIVEVFDRHLKSGLAVPGDFHAMQALKRLVERGGVGESGIDFFAVPGLTDPTARRDYLMLKSLGDALTLAASDNFKAAFGNSTDQRDYRWGKLHRITLVSPLGPPYTVPSAGNRFTPPLPGLSGIPVDGGANVPDVAGHPLRADDPEKFTVSLVPARRFVAQAEASCWRTVDSLPGGVSERPGHPYEQNLLRGWLANETYPLTRS